MSIKHGMWLIGEDPVSLKSVGMESEELLEDQIFKDISILNPNWLLIGRQVLTDYGNPLDLLAVDASGSLIVIELKKHKTPRDVVAQAIDYASWVEHLKTDDTARIYNRFCERYGLPERSLSESFEAKFGIKPEEDSFNISHQIVIVAAELDASTERIVNYLNDKNIAVNVVFFSVFEDGDKKYLSRAWMIDPSETEDRAINAGERAPWNGEYYVSFGIDEHRSWVDAKKYGFISAGGGRWYTQGLSRLNPGDRVWVKNPGQGFLGVGEVSGEVMDGEEFLSENMELDANYMRSDSVGSDNAEYFVPVNWQYTVEESDAVNELGMFGNQNIVARPQTDAWPWTVDRLKKLWNIS